MLDLCEAASYPERSPSPEAHRQPVAEHQPVPEEPVVVVALLEQQATDAARRRNEYFHLFISLVTKIYFFPRRNGLRE